MTHKPVFMEGIFTLRNVRSMGAAALVEVLIALGLAGALLWQRLQPPIEQPSLPIIDPTPDVPRQIPLQPRSVPEPARPQIPRLSEVPSVPADIPGPNVQPVQAPTLPVQQAPADVVNEFAARMLRAIEAQKVYPHTSLLKGETGETVVSFDYADGVVSDVRVVSSSGSHDLDQAAIDAVEKAALPAKPAEPAELAALTHFEFHLVFDIGGR